MKTTIKTLLLSAVLLGATFPHSSDTQDPYTAEDCTHDCQPVLSATSLTQGCALVTVSFLGASPGQAGHDCTPKCSSCNARVRSFVDASACEEPIDWVASAANYDHDCTPAPGQLSNGTATGIALLPVNGLKTCCGGFAHYHVMANGTSVLGRLECRCPGEGQ